MAHKNKRPRVTGSACDPQKRGGVTMARKRMIDPDLWNDPDFGSMTGNARLLFVALVSLADDEGRGEADPRRLAQQVFGFVGIGPDEVRKMLDEIEASLRGVRFYQSDGRGYYHLANWKQYQKISHPSPSRLPAPPAEDSVRTHGVFTEPSVNTHGTLSEDSVRTHPQLVELEEVGEGKEGEAPPPPRPTVNAPESAAPKKPTQDRGRPRETPPGESLKVSRASPPEQGSQWWEAFREALEAVTGRPPDILMPKDFAEVDPNMRTFHDREGVAQIPDVEEAHPLETATPTGPGKREWNGSGQGGENRVPYRVGNSVGNRVGGEVLPKGKE